MLTGTSVNCTITVGSAEDSTLTVGASCCPKDGVRKASGVVGKAGPPVFVPGVAVLVVGGTLDVLQALTSNPSNMRIGNSQCALKTFVKDMNWLLS
jgi:hypothetical protein